MLARLTSRIAYRLLLWFLLLALVPLFFVTTLLFGLSQRAQEQLVTDNLTAIANSKVQQIETYVLERQRDVSSLALLPDVAEATITLNSLAREADTTSAAYAETTAVLDALLLYYQQQIGYENVLLFSDDDVLLFSLRPSPQLGQRYSDFPQANPELLRALENARTLLETDLSNFTETIDGDPVAYIAAPILTEGVVVGVVVIEINQDELFQVVTERTSLGETGETLVGLQVGEQLLVTAPLYHEPDAAFQKTLALDSPTAFALAQAVRGIQGQGETEDYRQQPVVAAWRYLPSLRWGMVVKLDQNEAYAALDDQRRITFGLGALTLLVVVLATVTVARTFSKPITSLSEAVLAFRQGHLGARANLRQRDEIGLLGESFNQMADQIANQVQTLEAEVAARTEALQVSNHQLSTIAAVSQEVSRLSDPQDLLPLIATTVQRQFGFQQVVIYRAEGDQLHLAAMAGPSTPADSDQSIGLDAPGFIADAARARQHQLRHSDTTAELVLPLVREDTLLGILHILTQHSGELTEETVPNFRVMAQQLTAALVNAQLYQQTQAYAEDMAQARQAADEANRAKSTFLSNMSHELRTPLNAIIGFSQVMQRDNVLTRTQTEHLDIILRSGEHLLSLINDVLEMSKIEAGRTTLNESAFDLHLLLQNIAEIFRIQAEAQTLQWICDYNTDHLPQYVWSDEGKLRQILINLVGNAFKFTQEGGVTLRLAYQPEGHLLMAEVEDTGSGIGAEEIKYLFEPFMQTTSGRKSQEGTGLGLAISRQFVQLMGGDIQVNSQPGVGTLFKFSVVVREGQAQDVKTEHKRRVKALKTNQTYKMLVVDDRADNRRLLREWLSSVGLAVQEAENGQEAIEMWETWSPHMIWMDMRMPVMDGYEATRRIKQTTHGMATVIIAFTASAFEHEQNIVLSAGCDDFVRKPARESEIFEMIAKHLGVELIYEEEPAPTPADTPLNDATIMAQLQQLSPGLRAALLEAAESIDTAETARLIQQIDDPALAHALTDAAENFRFDLLQTWLS